MEPKRFHGAPFGVQSSRFDISGAHPNNKYPGTFTQVNYCKTSMSEMQRRLAPGRYSIDSGDFSESSLSRKSSGPGWKEAKELAQKAKLPHLLYRKEWLKKKELIRKRGPGMYDVEKYDMIRELNKKSVSPIGVCGTQEERFRGSTPREVFPGPGTYGVPTTILEEKEKKSPGNVGMLDSGTFGRYLPTVGCHLAPGRYDIQSDKDKIYNRVVSKRGPYDVFSENRSKVKTGHYATSITYNLGPGQYDLRSFIEEMNSNEKKKHGLFLKDVQYRQPPGDRIFYSTLAQCPRDPSFPAPDTYFLDPPPPRPNKSPPFLFVCKRFDKRSNIFFTGNKHALGPGRYEIDRWSKFQHQYACGHMFEAKTKRFESPSREAFLKERVRAKDFKVAQRTFGSSPDVKA